MNYEEVMSNEVKDLTERLEFLQECQAKENKEGDEDKDNESPSWPTITSQMM